MNPVLAIGLPLIFLTIIDCAVLLIRPRWYKDWSFVFLPIYLTMVFVMVLIFVILRYWLPVVINSLLGLWIAWCWWHDEHNRRKRKKLLDRAAGRVKDMGGRLKVVRPSET